jgi:hypothetical protein
MGESGADPALVASQSSQQAVSTKGFDPGELEALAERCEQATGPDKRIDLTIFATLHPDEFADAAEARQYASTSYQREMNNADWYYISTIGLPRYTTSLDAAMTLVPEGWAWSLNSGAQGECFARVSPKSRLTVVDAATPALAFCAAALRARASQDTPSPPEDM